MNASVTKLRPQEELTPQRIKAIVASTPNNALYYRDMRAALPEQESSAPIIKLLVEMRRRKEVAFDNTPNLNSMLIKFLG